MGNLLEELKRRKVFRVTAVYAVAAWLLIQIVDVVLPTFNAPQWVSQTIILVLMLGLPVTAVLAWAFEITPEGIQITEASIPAEAGSLRKRDYFVGAALLGLIAVVVVQQFALLNRPVLDESIASEGSTAETLSRVDELVGDIAGIPIEVIEKSVAVLPFVSFSSGAEDGYFADGLTEELLNVLAQISDLKVPGRTSSFYYKGKDIDLREIGEALGVAYLLEGSVRRAGDQLRITAQLVSAADGFHLWSETYDRTMDDIFAIQDEIANEVTQALRIELLGEEAESIRTHGTDNAEAQNLYLIATARLREQSSIFFSFQTNPEPVSRTRGLFEEVTRLDPDYADAWAGLVEVTVLLSSSVLLDGAGFLLDQYEGLELAQAALERAQSLAPNAPSTLLAAASVAHAAYQRNFGGEAELEAVVSAYDRALLADPNNVIALERSALFHLAANKPAEAIKLYDRALALDPLSTVAMERATAIGFSTNPELARQLLKRTGDLYPEMPWQQGIAMLEYQKGHLHHGFILAAASQLGALEKYAIASLGDTERAIELNAGVDADTGGSLGEFGSNLSYMFARDYSGLTATLPEFTDPTGEADFAFQAAFRFRQFDAAIAYLRFHPVEPMRQLVSGSELKLLGIHGLPLEAAYALQQTGNTTRAAAIRARFRENMARELTQEGFWHIRAQHELDLLLLASEGEVNQALDAFDALYADGWHWLSGPGNNIVSGYLFSSAGHWFEDNPMLDSIREEPRFIATLNKIKAENAAMLAELNAGLSVEDVLNEEW